ncbi:uncharacterized protein [Melanerpes formicivorus]|uniref:uncharacterized protein isoform X1 n=1 Tax=Melanerpes formicivorus TaxID=211600 RepID=UPI00358FF40F
MASFFMTALKSFQRGEEEPPKGPPKDGRAGTLPNGMAREEFEEYQRQLLEEKIERDKAFAQRKAGRAAVRMHLRDKYHLAQVRSSPPVTRPRGSFASPCILWDSPRLGGCWTSLGWEMAPEEGSKLLLSAPAPSAASLHPTVPDGQRHVPPAPHPPSSPPEHLTSPEGPPVHRPTASELVGA